MKATDRRFATKALVALFAVLLVLFSPVTVKGIRLRRAQKPSASGSGATAGALLPGVSAGSYGRTSLIAMRPDPAEVSEDEQVVRQYGHLVLTPAFLELSRTLPNIGAEKVAAHAESVSKAVEEALKALSEKQRHMPLPKGSGTEIPPAPKGCPSKPSAGHPNPWASCGSAIGSKLAGGVGGQKSVSYGGSAGVTGANSGDGEKPGSKAFLDAENPLDSLQTALNFGPLEQASDVRPSGNPASGTQRPGTPGSSGHPRFVALPSLADAKSSLASSASRTAEQARSGASSAISAAASSDQAKALQSQAKAAAGQAGSRATSAAGQAALQAATSDQAKALQAKAQAAAGQAASQAATAGAQAVLNAATSDQAKELYAQAGNAAVGAGKELISHAAEEARKQAVLAAKDLGSAAASAAADGAKQAAAAAGRELGQKLDSAGQAAGQAAANLQASLAKNGPIAAAAIADAGERTGRALHAAGTAASKAAGKAAVEAMRKSGAAAKKAREGFKKAGRNIVITVNHGGEGAKQVASDAKKVLKSKETRKVIKRVASGIKKIVKSMKFTNKKNPRSRLPFPAPAAIPPTQTDREMCSGCMMVMSLVSEHSQADTGLEDLRLLLAATCDEPVSVLEETCGVVMYQEAAIAAEFENTRDLEKTCKYSGLCF